MRTIDDIIADSQKSIEALLREAYAAGHSHATTDLKSKMAAFFDSLVSLGMPQEEPPAPQPYAEAHPMEPINEPYSEQRYD